MQQRQTARYQYQMIVEQPQAIHLQQQPQGFGKQYYHHVPQVIQEVIQQPQMINHTHSPVVSQQAYIENQQQIVDQLAI